LRIYRGLLSLLRRQKPENMTELFANQLAFSGPRNLSRQHHKRGPDRVTANDGRRVRCGSSARVTAPRLLFSAPVFGKRPLTVRSVADEVRIS
jgi:hypothetical protein